MAVHEVEMKFAAADFAAAAARLRGLGAVECAAERHVDAYFNAPDRDFAVTDEALRLRTVDQETVMTYKGPKVDASTKTRLEIEVPFDAKHADGLSEILVRLGYQPVRKVQKTRQVWTLEWRGWPAAVGLDSVDGLPPYIELEILAEQQQLDEARLALAELANRLELNEPERRSYLQMLLETDAK